MNGDPENRSESGSEEEEHRHRQLANGIKNQRITKAQARILNRMEKFTKRMPLGRQGGSQTGPGRVLFVGAILRGQETVRSERRGVERVRDVEDTAEAFFSQRDPVVQTQSQEIPKATDRSEKDGLDARVGGAARSGVSERDTGLDTRPQFAAERRSDDQAKAQEAGQQESQAPVRGDRNSADRHGLPADERDLPDQEVISPRCSAYRCNGPPRGQIRMLHFAAHISRE